MHKNKKAFISWVSLLWPWAAILFVEMMMPKYNDPVCLLGLVCVSLFGFVFTRSINHQDPAKILKDLLLLITCSILIALSFAAFIWFEWPAYLLGFWMLFSVAFVFVGYKVFHKPRNKNEKH